MMPISQRCPVRNLHVRLLSCPNAFIGNPDACLTWIPVKLVLVETGKPAGLTANDLKNLFGKYTRLSALPTGGESSTGLGLSIVKQLVELHGGKVWAESKGKDKGATFFVELS
ncbi:MAG: sensor histidine kinase [Candidatus Anammoxibacter sp.]